MRIKGTVKWFNDAKGFGYVRTPSLDQDIFIHYSAIKCEGFQTVSEGEEIEFDLVDGAKGAQAFNVIRLNQEGSGYANTR